MEGRLQPGPNSARPGCFYAEPRESAVKSARNVRPDNSGRTTPPFVRDPYVQQVMGEGGMSETSAGRQVMVRAQVAQDPSYGSDPGQTHDVPMVEPGGLSEVGG